MARDETSVFRSISNQRDELGRVEGSIAGFLGQTNQLRKKMGGPRLSEIRTRAIHKSLHVAENRLHLATLNFGGALEHNYKYRQVGVKRYQFVGVTLYPRRTSQPTFIR